MSRFRVPCSGCGKCVQVPRYEKAAYQEGYPDWLCVACYGLIEDRATLATSARAWKIARIYTPNATFDGTEISNDD